MAVQLEPTGPGHYTSVGASLPFTGTWTMRVDARYGEFDLVTFQTSFDVR